jgi:hypothetical protein
MDLEADGGEATAEVTDAGADETVTGAETVTGDGVEPAGEAVAEGAGDGEPTAEEAIQDGEVQGLSPKGQAEINKRLGKLTKRAKSAEEQAAATAAEHATLKEEHQALKSKLEALAPVDLTTLGVDLAYVSPEEAKQLADYDGLQADEAWLLNHLDGYEASGQGQDTKSYTPAQVRSEYARVSARLRALSPVAEGLRRDKAALMRRHLELGRAAEKAGWTPGEKAAAVQEKKPPMAAKGREAAGAKVAPKPVAIPGAGGAAAGSPRPSDVRPAKSGGFTSKDVFAKGGGRAALEALTLQGMS